MNRLKAFWRLIHEPYEGYETRAVNGYPLARLFRQYYLRPHWPRLLLILVLGSLTGLGVSVVLPQLTPIMAIPSWEPFILALAFALLVGTFFGVQPARRAARLHPVEALQ